MRLRYAAALAICFVLVVPRSSSATLQIFGVAPDGNIIAASDSGACAWDGSSPKQSAKLRSLGKSGVFLTAGLSGVSRSWLQPPKTTTVDFTQIVEDWAAKHPRTDVGKARAQIQELIENSLGTAVFKEDNVAEGTLLEIRLMGFVSREPTYIDMGFKYHHPAMRFDQEASSQTVLKPNDLKMGGERVALVAGQALTPLWQKWRQRFQASAQHARFRRR